MIEMSCYWIHLPSRRGWFSCQYLSWTRPYTQTFYLERSVQLPVFSVATQTHGFSPKRIANCSTNVKGWKPQPKYFHQATYGITCICWIQCWRNVQWNSMLVFTIVQGCTGKYITSLLPSVLLLVLYTVTIRGNKHAILPGSFVLWWYLYYTRAMHNIVGRAEPEREYMQWAFDIL